VIPFRQLELEFCSLHGQHASAVATNAHGFECNAANQGPSLRFGAPGSS